MVASCPEHPLTLPITMRQVDTKPTVGLIVLTTDMTCEDDFSTLAVQHRCGFHQYVNRISFCNPMTEANLLGMLNNLGQVAENIVPGHELDAIVFCCTSGSAIIGDQAIEEAIQNTKTCNVVLTTARASVATLRRKGFAKISLLTPYSAPVSRRLAEYFQASDIQITALHYMDIADDRDVGRLSPEYILAAAQAAADHSADCLFISCTAMRVVEIREKIEARINQPVVSSNYATFLETMYQLDLLHTVDESGD
ncbi:MAG: hypothetical protein KDI63_11170 [Gammaproteobacteria bacterium]|nr:hypothetical protein [Gammaproteobacteria bacterium]